MLAEEMKREKILYPECNNTTSEKNNFFILPLQLEWLIELYVSERNMTIHFPPDMMLLHSIVYLMYHVPQKLL